MLCPPLFSHYSPSLLSQPHTRHMLKIGHLSSNVMWSLAKDYVNISSSRLLRCLGCLHHINHTRFKLYQGMPIDMFSNEQITPWPMLARGRIYFVRIRCVCCSVLSLSLSFVVNGHAVYDYTSEENSCKSCTCL